MRVCKKPIEVEARGPLTESEMVVTAHGRVRAEAGDYVLNDPRTGDTWPIKPDIYATTYESAERQREHKALVAEILEVAQLHDDTDSGGKVFMPDEEEWGRIVGMARAAVQERTGEKW